MSTIGAREPAPLDEWDGRPVDALRAEWDVPRLLVFECVGSTNDVARSLAEAGAPAGTVVIAEAQTAGRGREGRPWHGAPGRSLLLSVVLRPQGLGEPTAAPGAIPLRIGLAVAHAVEAVAGATARAAVRLKWPNDVVAEDGRKLAGILCEGSIGAGGGFLIAGIGVNVAQRPNDFPPEIRGTATSLRQIAGRAPSRAALAAAIVAGVRAPIGRLAGPLGAAELDEIAARDALRDHAVAVDGAHAGVAIGIGADGALHVRTPAGRIRAIHAGTVRRLPAQQGENEDSDP